MRNLKALVAITLLGVAVLGFSKKSAAQCADNPSIPNLGYCVPYGDLLVCVYGGFTCDVTDINQDI